MRERFNTDGDATVVVDDTELEYENVVFRAEGIAPGDCRKYFRTDDGYETMRDTLRPSIEHMVYEVEITFDDTVPLLLDDLDTSGDTLSLTFACDGHEIENVNGQVHDITDGVVTIAGEYDLGMPEPAPFDERNRTK